MTRKDVNGVLRILMVLHMPWDRNLGGPRVQLELAEELERMGHKVAKFDLRDAFPSGLKEWSRNPRLFSEQAAAFLRRHHRDFDVVDAHQGNLPFTARELGFPGLVVGRSVGLYALYDEFQDFERIQWPPRNLKARLGHVLRSLGATRSQMEFRRSLECADVLIVMNEDESTYIAEKLTIGTRCEVIPYGLARERREALAPARDALATRLQARRIAFIGAWGPRKGSRDWGAIIRQVRVDSPDARFLFLGTGAAPESVLSDLELPPCDWIEIVPGYMAEELPALLRDATIGALPTYIEGFGIGLLECLAAGIPAIAYDVPGPREMLRGFQPPMMVPPGDTNTFAGLLSRLLGLSAGEYGELCARALNVTDRFHGEEVARRTLAVYTSALASLGDRGKSTPQ